MDNKQIWTTVIIAIVVAVIASVITSQITGNIITVKTSPTGEKVYTTQEVDFKIKDVNTKFDSKINDVNTKIVELSDSGVIFHTLEGEKIKVGDYAVLDSPIRNRILKSIAIDYLASNAKVSFKDALSGETISVTVGSTGEASTTIDGRIYYFKVFNSNLVNSVIVTWGAGAASGKVGTETTAYIGQKTELKN